MGSQVCSELDNLDVVAICSNTEDIPYFLHIYFDQG